MDDKERTIAILYEDASGIHWLDRRSGRLYWMEDGSSLGNPFQDFLMIIEEESEYWSVRRLSAPSDSTLLGTSKTVCARVFDSGRVEVYLDRLPPCAQEYFGLTHLYNVYGYDTKEGGDDDRGGDDECILPM